MRVLLLNTDYPAFLSDLYVRHTCLADASFAEQMRVRNDSQFGTADFYSCALHQLGHEAWDVHFKLHAPQNTTVECELRGGKIVKLEVTPASRKTDVQIVGPAPTPRP